MRLDVGAPLARHVPQAARDGVEGVADRDVDILVRMVLGRISIDRDLRAGDLQIDPDLVEPSLALAAVRRSDGHPAADDTAVELVQTLEQFAYPLPRRGRRLHVAEGDLQRKWHGVTSSFGLVSC